jgi:hypothetical protein
MPQWLDEQYMWMSVATLLGFVWILYRFAYPPEDAVEVGTAAVEATTAAPAVPHVPRRNTRRGGGGGGGGGRRRGGGRRGRR